MKPTKRLLIMTMAALSLQGCWVTATGEKTGIIVKLSSEGAFVNTHEAELIRGGMNSGSGAFGKPFFFTIPSDSMAAALNVIMEKQQQVKIKYHTEAVCSPFRSEMKEENNCTFLDSFSISEK